ncbi:hypothetical protein D9M68_520740 [compost metagenome]
MKHVSQSGAAPARRHCCPLRHDRLPGTGRMTTSGSGRTGRLVPDRPCPECGSIALRPRHAMPRLLPCCVFDARPSGYQQIGPQCRARRRKAHRYGREPRVRSRICSRSRCHGSRVASAPNMLPLGSEMPHPLQAHKASRSPCSRRLEGCRSPA